MTTHVDSDAPGVRFLGFLGVAASAEGHPVPGERIDFPLNWGEVRFFTRIFVLIWLVLAIIFLIPAVGRFFAGPTVDVGVRWKDFLLITGLFLFATMAVRLRNLRSASLEFSTAGIWAPSAGGGYFLPWQAVNRVRLVNNSFIRLDHDGGRLKIYALAFADPYAVSKFIRAHVPGGVADKLPTESYD